MKSKDLLERYKQFLVTNDAAGLFGDVTTSQGRRRSSNTETRERFLGWVSELAEVQVNGSTGEKTLALRPEQWSRRTTPSGLGFGCTTTDDVQGRSGASWSCPGCTFMNGAGATDCSMCNTPRASWTCSVCSASNGPDSDSCKQCTVKREPTTSTPMPTSTPAASSHSSVPALTCHDLDLMLLPDSDGDASGRRKKASERAASSSFRRGWMTPQVADMSHTHLKGYNP